MLLAPEPLLSTNPCTCPADSPASAPSTGSGSLSMNAPAMREYLAIVDWPRLRSPDR